MFVLFIKSGAHTIIVLGVSPISPSSQMVFDELKRKFTTNVIHIRVNIANEEEMRVLDKRLDALPPVAGVINSAGILDDKEFTDIDRASYRRVMGPKVNGKIYLPIKRRPFWFNDNRWYHKANTSGNY